MLNKAFVKQHGQVRFFAAPMATVTIGDRVSHHQVCQISFQKKDGSIFIQCPYFPGHNGIISAPPHDSAKGPPYTYSLSDHGKLTSHLVKLSHHPDGNVHFSQDGKILTQIGRASFDLRQSIGHVFQLHVYHPRGFKPFTKTKNDRVYLPFAFEDELPEAIVIAGEWRRKCDLEANTDPPGDVTGPLAKIRYRKTGGETTAFFFGQPFGFPLRDHVLMIGAEASKALEGVTEPLMILMGGYDPHEVKEGDPAPKHTGMLSWWYPFEASEEGRKRIGSVDLNPAPQHLREREG